jgi:hypothetical protein
MEPIKIEKTFSTPEVVFTPNNHTLMLEGRLIPENAETVFKPIIDWIDNYFANGGDTLKLLFRLYYYNTSSSKRIVNLMRKLDEYAAAGKKINIRWEYEEGDDDCMHDGNDFAKMVKVIPVEVIEIEEI